MTFEGMAAEFARVIRLHGRCACQMRGGAKWHCMAKTEVVKQCGFCRVLTEYDAMLTPTVQPEAGEALEPI